MITDDGASGPLPESACGSVVYKHTDGWYYFTATVTTVDLIELRSGRMEASFAHRLEKIGYPVNEHPAHLIRNGSVFISYSASATDANYHKLGWRPEGKACFGIPLPDESKRRV